MESLEIEVDVNEAYLQRVRPGGAVTARLDAYPAWRIPAEVIAIVPAANREKATVRVRVGILERDARILPDMGAKVSFIEAGQPAPSALEPAPLTVPRRRSWGSTMPTGCSWPGRGRHGGAMS